MELTLDEQCDRGLKPNQTELCRNPECHFTPIVQILSPNIAGKNLILLLMKLIQFKLDLNASTNPTFNAVLLLIYIYADMNIIRWLNYVKFPTWEGMRVVGKGSSNFEKTENLESFGNFIVKLRNMKFESFSFSNFGFSNTKLSNLLIFWNILPNYRHTCSWRVKLERSRSFKVFSRKELSNFSVFHQKTLGCVVWISNLESLIMKNSFQLLDLHFPTILLDQLSY